ncbi:prephenate dehydrogenase [Anaerobacillus alkalilacustris]|uniref:Prephenate dehydrogenase n=1 Tax=Anaerobacillus alkalilacustris TaxID=393763 RepID=A0A1S2LQM5_9BACI|nr:prephenate dehydrogenase [Anaerobacillus alkalilacustris]OIJ14802.1 prephenate dehydrogenase [Anaerobacillus alkalilacustris]
MNNRKVFVIGLGLIGGSIALAIKKEHKNCMIYGFDIKEDQLKMAKSLGVIDEFVDQVEKGVEDADLIILAAPVKKTEEVLINLASYNLKASAIITDVGSTKEKIVEKAQVLQGKGVTFIGGHPMAGSHKTGVEAAKAHLFENAFYILTPSEGTNMTKIIQLQNWLKGTKAKFIEMSPSQHDQIAGVISHFPHLIAASLVHQVAKIEKEQPLLSNFAAGGFRDITRIASASPVMWRDILIHNKEILLSLLSEWQKEMDYVKGLIEKAEDQSILQYFHSAKMFRDELPIKQKGAIPSFYDLYVDVPDHPGVISDVTGILSKENISITNIRILETREDIMGVLRLSFRSDQDRDRALTCLAENLYEAYISS